MKILWAGLVGILLLGTSAESSRRGVEYLRSGDYKKAIPLLGEGFQSGWAYENLGKFETAIKHYRKSRSILKPYATYRIAHCLKELGRYEQAIDHYEKLVDNFPGFVFIKWAMRELGWCYEKTGDYENASDVWDYEFEPPFSWYKTAQLYDKMGKRSAQLWTDIATKHPACEYAIKAVPVLPSDSSLLIGKIYYFARKYDSAIAQLDGLAGGEEFLALSLYKKREYEKALQLARDNGFWLVAGNCSKRLDRREEAVRNYAKSSKAEALFLKALLLLDLNEREEALLAFSSIPDTFNRYQLSCLRAGLLAFELGHLDVAHKAFRKAPPPISYYWCYRVKRRQSDQWYAQAYRDKLLRDHPISYYAFLLQGKSGILDVNPEDWIATTFPCSLSSDELERFERGKLLVDFGITKYGAAEFRRLPSNPLLWWKAAKCFHANGLTWLAIPYARRLGSTGGLPREIAEVIYPKRFFSDISKAAREQNIDEFLFLSLVHQESHFNPGALSSSNAKGLSQIIPPTARLIAKDLGVRKYNIFDPSTNLRFGAHYFAGRLEQFGGCRECALAAYNAGPHRVVRWIAERDTAKMDEWVDWIPFKQTRLYVRKITRTYFAYKMLYGDSDDSSAAEQQPAQESKIKNERAN
jgi:tetratricopeptide (TPR) repeat protein